MMYFVHFLLGCCLWENGCYDEMRKLFSSAHAPKKTKNLVQEIVPALGEHRRVA